MATFEPSPDLDPAVAQAIQEAMDSLRAELSPRLAPPDSAPSARSATPAVSEPEVDHLALLEEALGALDAAPSQANLLSELLQQAGRFADRAVFFVLDNARFGGWAAFGFDTDQEHVTRAVVDADGGAWAQVARGAVAADLDADACAEVVDQIGGEEASAGVIVGFPLRGATAGALYADRTASHGAFDPSALRILTYVAAQALETLPLRRGRRAETGAVAPAAEPTEAAQVEPEAAATTLDVDDMIREVEVGGQEEREILEIHRDTAAPPFGPATELGAAIIDDTEEEAHTGFETVISGPDSGFETLAPEPGPDLESTEPEVEAAREVELPDIELPEVELPDVELPDVELPDVELPGGDGGVETQDEDAGFATQEISTLEATLGQDLLEERAAAPQREARALEPAEVAPPPDLEGPGWAFGGAGTITDDTRHEEARRLARLLVTEIKLYNEEKVREGREQNNLVDQLRDDLERSRRIYEERIDEEIRGETDYFQEECVRILAGGDSTALGG
jgi:hypothetical protein